jgi:Glycosyl-transferase for dystroglycan
MIKLTTTRLQLIIALLILCILCVFYVQFYNRIDRKRAAAQLQSVAANDDKEQQEWTHFANVSSFGQLNPVSRFSRAWHDSFIDVYFKSFVHGALLLNGTAALTRRMSTRKALDYCPASIGIATQMTLDRLPRLARMADNWFGPISAVLYVDCAQRRDAIKSIAALVQSSDSVRRRVDVHLACAERMLTQRYPINHLRNVAWQLVPTPLVLLLDSDFLPSGSSVCGDVARFVDVAPPPLPLANEFALVLPAFALHDDGRFDHGDKRHVGARIDAPDGIGQAATDYRRWRSAAEPYRVEHRFGYEPYVIVRTERTPRYDEQFVGYGDDKASHFFELKAAGYQLYVLPTSMVVHVPHGNDDDAQQWPGESEASSSHGNNRERRRQRNQLAPFLLRLQRKYPDSNASFFPRHLQ